MRKGFRVLLIALAILILTAAIGPFLVPVPPLENTVPPEDLGDADSQFVTVQGVNGVDGVRLHYKLQGQGEPAFILLHGFAASSFSWREVMGPLAKMGTVVAYDRPAFGLSERAAPGSWQGESPYGPDAQPELLAGLMDQLGLRRAILIGNSAGGTVALQMALRYPERVQALVLVDAAVYDSGSPFPAWLRPLLTTPQANRLGPLFVRRIQEWGLDFARSAWHDPSKITAATWEGYTKPLRAANWDVGLWQMAAASRPQNLAGQFSSIALPSLVITGDDDRIVKTEESIQLARELPGARLAVIPDCGHVPQEERPDAFMSAVTAFLEDGL